MTRIPVYATVPLIAHFDPTVSSGLLETAQVEAVAAYIEIDREFGSVLIPNLDARDGTASFLLSAGQVRPVFPTDQQRILLRGTISESDLDHLGGANRLDGDIEIFADPPVGPFLTCCGTPPVGSYSDVEQLLNVATLQAHGMDGKDVALAIVDVGINLGHLRKMGHSPNIDVAMSWHHPGMQGPGKAQVGHGTMCAYDALIAAPNATLLDIAALRPLSSPVGAAATLTGDVAAALSPILSMLTHGTFPYQSLVISNSWGVMDPSWDFPPGHPGRYLDNPRHPFSILMASLAAFGADILFAAGNCGRACPSPRCRTTSAPFITGANSHPDVITVGAVDVTGQPAGYTSPGPGALHPQKPDLAAYSHFLGSQAAGSGTADEGTSTSCPVVAGVVAAIRSKYPTVLTNPQRAPSNLKQLLIAEAHAAQGNPGFSNDVGWGIVATSRLTLPTVMAAL